MLEFPFMATYREQGYWGNPESLRQLERKKYPFLKGIQSVVRSIVNQYLLPGSSILEIGSGLGFVERLLPERSGGSYFSSDAYEENISAAKQLGIKEPLVADAEDLPIANNLMDGVLGMDVLSSLKDPLKGISEIQRILRPGGYFIHFQVNAPDRYRLIKENPNYVFFPDNKSSDSMRGISKAELLGLVTDKTSPANRVIHAIITDQDNLHKMILEDPDKELIVALAYLAVTLPGPQIYYPSIAGYYKSLYEKGVMQSGMTIVESTYRSMVVITPRTKHHKSPVNIFEWNVGAAVLGQYFIPSAETDNTVRERVTLQVVVGQKS